MATVFYADPATGKPVGFARKDGSDGIDTPAPPGWVQVPAPADGRDVWNFNTGQYTKFVPDPEEDASREALVEEIAKAIETGNTTKLKQKYGKKA